MDLAQEGAAASAQLQRMAGPQNQRMFAGFSASFHLAQKRLSAAYYLETGKHYQPRSASPQRTGPLSQCLRQQFLWEQNWTRACLRAAGQIRDPEIGSLLRNLGQEGNRHCQSIRALLERISLD